MKNQSKLTLRQGFVAYRKIENMKNAAVKTHELQDGEINGLELKFKKLLAKETKMKGKILEKDDIVLIINDLKL